MTPFPFRLGIYGGSFFPPHTGHLHAAIAFYDALQLDELLVIPAAKPPHKSLAGHFAPSLRLEMTKATFCPETVGTRKITVSDYEIAKGGVSYTAETLAHFAGEGRKLFLLCGSDMFLTLDSWYHAEDIFALAAPVLARREDDAVILENLLAKKEEYLKTFRQDSIFIDFPPFEISSGEIREKCSKGEPIRGLVTGAVEHLILEKGLFDEKTVLAKLRENIFKRESGKRAAHSLAVEEECRFLAEKFELTKEERFSLSCAALLHDITHELPGEAQCEILREHGYSEEEIENACCYPRTMHQVTGALSLPEDPDFAFLALPEVLDAIACHTTGAEEMSLIAKLLCLADYIEPTRPYERCQSLRRRFHERLAMTEGRYERLTLLDTALLLYLEGTAEYILSHEGEIDPKSIAAKDALLKNGVVKDGIL